MNFILGSGITGLLAKFILGDNWQLIPFGRSRFYSFVPPMADNHVVCHDDVEDVIRKLGFNPTFERLLRATSYSGQLLFGDATFVKDIYLDKLFHQNPHPAAKLLFRHELNIYRYATATEVYGLLQRMYKSAIDQAIQQYGTMSKISTLDRTITTQNGSYTYSKIVSTIPLDALMEYVGTPMQLPSIDAWYYHVTTPSLNLEGARQVFVADAAFDFYKVDKLLNNQYVFHCKCDLGNPIAYLGAFLNNRLSIENASQIKKAYPIGSPPNLNSIEQANIFPVGSHAQWDYFMDVSSSIRRLTRLMSSV